MILKFMSLPHGGAWIETKINFIFFKNIKSLPHGGAWIETMIDRLILCVMV